MLTTEEEAKTKRCQEAFGDGFTSATSAHVMTAVPINPFGHGYSGSHGVAAVASPTFCIGSACMAWRWHHPHPGATSRDGSHSQSFSVAVGFCGKAGRP